MRFILILFSYKPLSACYLLVIWLLQLLFALLFGLFQRTFFLPNLFARFPGGINGELFAININRNAIDVSGYELLDALL